MDNHFVRTSKGLRALHQRMIYTECNTPSASNTSGCHGPRKRRSELFHWVRVLYFSMLG